MIYSFSKIYFSIISTAAFIIYIHNLQKWKKIMVADKTTQTEQIMQHNIDSSNNCFDDNDNVDVEIVKTPENHIQCELTTENLIKYSRFNPNYWK